MEFEFSCRLQDLQKAFVCVMKAVAVKSTIETIKCVKFNYAGGLLTLTGFDCEVEITKSISAAGKTGDFIVFLMDAQILKNILNRFTYGKVIFSGVCGGGYLEEVRDEWVAEGAAVRDSLWSTVFVAAVSNGVHGYTLKCGDASEYPDVMHIPVNSRSVVLPQELLKRMLKRVVSVLKFGGDDGRCGVQFENAGGSFSLLGRSSIALSRCRERIESTVNFNFTLTKRSVMLLLKLLKAGAVTIYVSDYFIMFDYNGYSVFTKLMPVDLKPFARYFEEVTNMSAIVRQDEFLKLLDSVTANGSTVRLNFTDGCIALTQRGGGFEFTGEMDAVVTGEAKITLNTRCLRTVLRAFECETVELKLKSSQSPVFVRSVSECDFQCAVMPVIEDF